VLTSVAPTDAATDRYNDMLQRRLNDTVWSQCASWYRTGGCGRIFSTFPGTLMLLMWWLRRVRWEDYEAMGPGADKWRRRYVKSSCSATVLMAALPGVFCALVFAIFLIV